MNRPADEIRDMPFQARTTLGYDATLYLVSQDSNEHGNKATIV